MASSIFKPLLHQPHLLHLSSFSHCNYSSALNAFKFTAPPDSPFENPKFKPQLDFRKSSSTRHRVADTASGADSLSGLFDITKRARPKTLEIEPGSRRVILKDVHAKKKKKKGVNGNKTHGARRKVKEESPENTLRVGLDMCSKRGEVLGAIKLYDLARNEGVPVGQYHYAVLLYLCSSAATGTVQPAKSGTGSRSLSHSDPFHNDSAESLSEFNTEETEFDDVSTLDGLVQSMRKKGYYSKNDDGIQVSQEVKRVAIQKGFEVYERMCSEKVPMNEATLTSVARMAMAFGDGVMAFDMVKQMKEHGLNPRLRSYGPALSIFCSNGDVESAFEVERHMLEHGVYPEEPELEALLRVSVESGNSERVYYVLHKLRTSVRRVSPGTADLIEKWFRSKVASRVGKRKWDRELITRAMENGGGGWHGKGWLGNGKWSVCRSPVGSDGFCKCCGEKLVTIDLDPEETERFAESVASIAAQREKKSSFQNFQKWLDYYGPFEAVVDAANVGLYSQRGFKPSKVNAVVNGIRQKLPSKTWPLIVLHNRRITGEKMDEPFNKILIEKWKNADAIYATPTGSNDDWYWLYAAIKCRCLLVTNDEMRDHLFQILGNDFFPRWKERHQVRFSFTDNGPTFHMPPPCSVVIQESEKGHWHIPIVSEFENEDERIWLCVRRANSSSTDQDSSNTQKGSQVSNQKKRGTRIGVETASAGTEDKHSHHHQEKLKEVRYVKSVVLPSVFKDHTSILEELEAAEKRGACLVDFQI